MLFELWEKGTTGVIEEPDGWRAFFENEIDRQAISCLSPDSEIRIEEPEPVQPAPQECDPILVGERFYIAPPGYTELAPTTRLRLEIDAVNAFGTGRHETTQLCLEALERYMRPEFTVVDVGCGSGILSCAARLLGARQVFSCDIQNDALAHADFQGSADALASRCAELVVANITAAVVDLLAFELQRIAKPGGLIVVSGFIRENPPRCFVPAAVLSKDDWLCWICRPEDVTPLPQPPEGLSHRADWWL